MVNILALLMALIILVGCTSNNKCDEVLSQIDGVVFRKLEYHHCTMETGRDIQSLSLVIDSNHILEGLELKLTGQYLLNEWTKKQNEKWLIELNCIGPVHSVTRPCASLCNDYELLVQDCGSGKYLIGVLGN